MAETTVPDISKLDPDAGILVLALRLLEPEKLSQIERAVATSQEVQDASRLLLEEAQRFLELNRDVKDFLAFFQKRDLQIAATKLGRFTDGLESLKESESEYQRFLDQIQKMLRELLTETPPSPEVVPSRFSPLFDGRGAVDGHATGGLVPVDGSASEAGGLGTLVATFDGGAESVERLGETMGRFRQVSRDTMEEIDRVATAAFGHLEQVLIGFAETGKFEWRDLARVALGAIGDIFDAQLKAAGGASSGGGGIGGILSGITSTLGSLFGGGGGATPFADAAAAAGIFSPFEHGGRFAANQPILVGEAGPELLVPPMAGEIVPNHALGALGGPGAGAAPVVNITQNFDFKGASIEAVALLRREANRIKHELMAEIISSAQRGGAFARMSRI